MTSHYAVRLRDVGKTYLLGNVTVQGLKGVSLGIGRQRFTVVVGPSGSGKTTLLNLIGGIDAPSQGVVEVCGQEIGALSDNRLSDFRARHVGFIFQNFSLIPVLSAFENVEYPLLLTNTPKRERRDRTMALLEAVGLADQRHHRPNQMSGGQRQRVAIARALVKGPDVVLADEPTANLDSRTGRQIIDLMRDMQAKSRTTFIFSTHDRQVIDHADDILTIQDGELVGADRRAA
ncbi:MAG TPA: ABC transporter ATP-binding protein [Azospirillaceae bacterium]|nr:ABC transporter ATP-binding protein [Azospirillaceae bacterium]